MKVPKQLDKQFTLYYKYKTISTQKSIIRMHGDNNTHIQSKAGNLHGKYNTLFRVEFNKTKRMMVFKRFERELRDGSECQMT